MDLLKTKFEEAKSTLDKLHQKNPLLVYTFAMIGAGYCGFKLLKDIRGMLRYTVRPAYDLKKRYGTNWCVITGATDGIGKGFAFELAKRGMNVVLVGRNQQKLDDVYTQIKNLYKDVDIKKVIFDFNKYYTDDVIQDLTEKFEDIEKCSILVNNVGVASAYNHGDMEDQKTHNMINVNITANTVMTKIFIPKLLANDQRAAMINIGSFIYNVPKPTLAVYSASKAYIHQFSTSLAEEYKSKIDVIVSNTGYVKSNMNSGRYMFTITPDQHARGVLDKLGYDTETCGHYIHAIHQYYLERPIEGAIITYINNQRRKKFLQERDQADKEVESKKKSLEETKDPR
ncbi:unnamed protein product [Moneuplotes crassus]|uniref:Uncharacterized protein n=1 Tax=Euplotes crassus TaxID=5936 RepID=A0AAD1XLI4_EUPCR|nr:unnamed protein product [Moneuplotes crassus]